MHEMQEAAIAVGGNEWTHPRTGEIRVYLNDWEPLVGLEVEYYKSGNVRSATLNGKPISNTETNRLQCCRVWVDANGVVQLQRNGSTPRTLTDDHIRATIQNAIKPA